MTQVTFNNMVSEIPSAVANIEEQIVQIEAQIEALGTQYNDIKEFTLTRMVSASDAYLDNKASDLTISEGEIMTVCTSGSYGLMTQWVSGAGVPIPPSASDNITNWFITSGGGNPCTANNPIFWDPSYINELGPTQADIDQYNRQINYDKTLEHLYREFRHEIVNRHLVGQDDYFDTVTYGIVAASAGLALGKEILLKNKAKLQQVYSIYDNV